VQWQPPKTTTIGKTKRKKGAGPQAAYKLPTALPVSKCKLRLLRLERIKDFLLLEEEFLARQAAGKPREQQDEEEKSKVDELRGSPMSVGSIEEIIDDSHAIISSTNGPEYYVNIMSFVDKDQLEPGSTVLLHNKMMSIVGLLGDDVDPMVNVMKGKRQYTAKTRRRRCALVPFCVVCCVRGLTVFSFCSLRVVVALL